MYHFLKKCIKAFIPKSNIYKNELFFRKFYAVLYNGNTHECNICKNKLRSFVVLKNEDLLCPFCGSLSRNRRLWELLKEGKSLQGNVLHFSPSRSLYRELKKVNTINYFSSDFENEFLADYKYDITCIDQKNETFDTIICYHILEHIVDDQKAMGELYRVLKPDGKIYIQTPFKEGDTYENYSIVSSEDRLNHFGQEDHVRVYSINGLKKRLIKGGFNVTENAFSSKKDDYLFGLKSPETVLIVRKE